MAQVWMGAAGPGAEPPVSTAWRQTSYTTRGCWPAGQCPSSFVDQEETEDRQSPPGVGDSALWVRAGGRGAPVWGRARRPSHVPGTSHRKGQNGPRRKHRWNCDSKVRHHHLRVLPQLLGKGDVLPPGRGSGSGQVPRCGLSLWPLRSLSPCGWETPGFARVLGRLSPCGGRAGGTTSGLRSCLVAGTGHSSILLSCFLNLKR